MGVSQQEDKRVAMRSSKTLAREKPPLYRFTMKSMIYCVVKSVHNSEYQLLV